LIEPYKGKIYDPCCGSGGMFVQSMKFVENHQGNTKDISIYGQEGTTTTLKLAKMNLAIRGISGNLGVKADDTFSKDQHPDLKADFIMANPPFNQKDWRAADELTDDPRWSGYEVPPTGNANYGWILHMVSKLSENGTACFILANGALSGGGDEYKIRKKMIENHLVEAILVLPMRMFYTTDISVTLWVLNKNKKARTVQRGDVVRNYRNRENEVLFLDLRKWGETFEKKFIQFSEQHRADITNTFHTWQETRAAKEYQNIPEYCYSASIEEIRDKDFSLVPSKYIKFINRDENINFDEKMTSLQTEFSSLLQEETKTKADLLNVFKELGYEIKL
jgi:type I restriction enzyme M protein